MKILPLLLASALLGPDLLAAAPLASTPLASTGAPPTALAAEGVWRTRASDNVCGLTDARMLSNPAVVRFDELLNQTPEMKKLVREGIDRDSPEGVQLRDAARKRVTKACQAVRIQNGYCSVWRSIRHTGGKTAAEITQKVRAKL